MPLLGLLACGSTTTTCPDGSATRDGTCAEAEDDCPSGYTLDAFGTCVLNAGTGSGTVGGQGPGDGTTTDSGTDPDAHLSPPAAVDAPCWSWEVTLVDGEPHETRLEWYDASVHFLGSEDDEGPDGRVDASSMWVWEGDHDILRTYDDNHDGLVDKTYSRTWDGDLLTAYIVDTPADVYARVFRYEGDRLVSMEQDNGYDGTVDIWYHYIYGADGRIERIDGDAGNDGTVDEVYHYRYDGPGPDYSYEADPDADGIIDETYRYEFDPVHEDNTVFYSRFEDNGSGDEAFYTWDPTGRYVESLAWNEYAYGTLDLVYDVIYTWEYHADRDDYFLYQDTWLISAPGYGVIMTFDRDTFWDCPA